LFELLSDRRPFRRGGLTATNLALAVEGDDAPHPSEVAETPWRRQLRGDLDAIVAKALRREPDRRYGSAHELAMDLDRFRRGLPVEAQPDSNAYRLSRFVARHRVGVVVGALVVMLLIAGLVATLWQARIASHERDLARLEAEKAQEAAATLIDLISLAEPGEKGMDADAARTLLEHGAERLQTRIGADERMRADLLHALGRGYINLGHPKEGIPLLQESLQLRRSMGDEGVETLRLMRMLGDSWAGHGEPELGREIYLEGLEITRRTRGDRDIHVANFNEGLATLANTQGHYAEAESLYRWNLELRSEIQGENHVDLATTYNNMATLLSVQGRLPEAEEAFLEALDRWEKGGKENHPVAAATLNNLAIVRYGQGDLAGAIEAQERAVAIHRELGTDGLDFANSLNSLASYLRAIGRYAEAEAMAREALTSNLEVLGEGDIRTAAARLNLGRILGNQGRFEEAETELEIGTHSFGELTGPESFYYAAARSIQGELQLRRGRLVAAERSLREAMRIQEAMLPAGVSRYADTCLWLGETLTNEDRLAEAEPLLRTAVVIRDSLQTHSRWLSAEVESALAECLYLKGEVDASRELAAGSHAELARVLGEDHPLSREAAERVERFR
jgi:serine/threonine-protein kinase